MLKVLVACGGTGGHIFPALAIAQEMQKQAEIHLVFCGRPMGMERDLLSSNYSYASVRAVPLVRGSIWANIALPWRFIQALLDAKKLISTEKPNMVVATGGYVSLPLVLWAGMQKIPVYLQEQNAVGGIANRLGARLAKKIFVTSREAAGFFPAGKTVIAGNPIRPLPALNTLPVPELFRATDFRILVMGGSQGALGINRKMEEILPQLLAQEGIAVLWQCGKRNYDKIRLRVGEDTPRFRLVPFLEDVYAWMYHASLLVSRAGASTLAELLALGKPSVLFPFPYATANHQEHNARVVEKAGAALVELDSEKNGLLEKIQLLRREELRLQDMSLRARQIGMPDAATRIAQQILESEGVL